MTFVHLQTAMIRCFGSLDFYFIDIDTEFLKKLETWLRTKAHYSDNSIGIRFRSLRTLYNQAVADNLVNITLLIFSLLYTGAGTRPGNARKIRIRMNSRCLLLKGKDYFPVRTMFGEKKRRRFGSGQRRCLS